LEALLYPWPEAKRPWLNIEPRRYRFRCLNGSNSRFLILKIVSNPLATKPATAVLPF
jgi:spore coat protein A, manganese oxidase